MYQPSGYTCRKLGFSIRRRNGEAASTGMSLPFFSRTLDSGPSCEFPESPAAKDQFWVSGLAVRAIVCQVKIHFAEVDDKHLGTLVLNVVASSARIFLRRLISDRVFTASPGVYFVPFQMLTSPEVRSVQAKRKTNSSRPSSPCNYQPSIFFIGRTLHVLPASLTCEHSVRQSSVISL